MLKRSIPFELGSILRFTAAIFAVTSACFGVSGLLSTTIFRRSGLVQPAFRIVFSLLRIPSGEESIQIFRIFEIIAKNRRGVCVMHDVLAEFFVILQNVVDQPAQEKNVRTCAQGNPNVGHRRSAVKSRINMNDLRPALARLNHPLKSHGMVFRHRRSRSEEHTSELQSPYDLVCRLLLEKKK